MFSWSHRCKVNVSVCCVALEFQQVAHTPRFCVLRWRRGNRRLTRPITVENRVAETREAHRRVFVCRKDNERRREMSETQRSQSSKMDACLPRVVQQPIMLSFIFGYMDLE